MYKLHLCKPIKINERRITFTIATKVYSNKSLNNKNTFMRNICGLHEQKVKKLYES